MEVEEDFHINHSIANLHIWLICTRLNDFTQNKFAEQLRDGLVAAFNEFTTQEIFNLDVLRKGRKVEDIEDYLHANRQTLDFHFYINSRTAANPAFKADALVWSVVYHSKVPRYSDKVYRMAAYLLEHFKYVKTLSYQDIERGDIDWNAVRVPQNYKDQLLKYNPPLS